MFNKALEITLFLAILGEKNPVIFGAWVFLVTFDINIWHFDNLEG